jgi:hypothetical protein
MLPIYTPISWIFVFALSEVIGSYFAYPGVLNWFIFYIFSSCFITLIISIYNLIVWRKSQNFPFIISAIVYVKLLLFLFGLTEVWKLGLCTISKYLNEI